MQTVRIFHLKKLSTTSRKLIYAGQEESGKLWNFCCETHKNARESKKAWPSKNSLQALTKSNFALHSQSIQMVCHAFLANVNTACQLKKMNKRIRLPYKQKKFYPLLWPKQAIKWKEGYLILPMGRKGRPIRLKVDLEKENIGASKIIWDDGYQLHVVIESSDVEVLKAPQVRATVDLGQIHLAAITTETGRSTVVSGRGIRTLKQQRNKLAGHLAKKQIRCSKGSRRWKKLQRAKRKVYTRTKRRVRDLRHKATSQVMEFCKEQGVTNLYVGNPEGVQKKNSGRHQNQRMSQWEFGKDISYLEHKSKKMGIVCFNGSERGTSSCCPQCDHKQKVKGRLWQCRRCNLILHRDVVGSMNMFPLGFGIKIGIPSQITYLQPGKLKQTRRSSSLGTGQSCFAKLSESNQQASCVMKMTGGFGEMGLQEAHSL